MFGLPFVIFRPHNVYGEYQNLGDPYRNVIGIFMNQIMQGKPMTIFGDGEQQRAFSYVGDIAPFIAQSPWTDGARNEVFNIGADCAYSVNELAKEVASAMGRPDHPIEAFEPAERSGYRVQRSQQGPESVRQSAADNACGWAEEDGGVGVGNGHSTGDTVREHRALAEFTAELGAIAEKMKNATDGALIYQIRIYLCESVPHLWLKTLLYSLIVYVSISP